MRHLSALDALFLQLETPDTPMHVGSLMLLEKPKGRAGRPGMFRSAVRDHIASRIHLAPVFTRKLGFMPLDLANPVWLRDANVDLDYHIRALTLPRPGTAVQLDAAIARLHATMLDRARPLWEFTVIDGLQGGELAFYAKIHHAALDGQGGVAVATVLLDMNRVAKAAPANVDALPARAPPSVAKMLGAALRNTIAQYGRILTALPSAVKAAGRLGAVALLQSEVKKQGLKLGPRTALNVAIGPGRSFATARIALDEAKAIAKHFDVKLNDVVLATCAGALRRHFAGNKAALAKAMIGAVPASLRAPGDTTQANYVTMMLVGLATHIADPVKRMRAIQAASLGAKMLTGSMKNAIPTDMPSLGVPWLMAKITPLYRKAAVANRIPVIANVVISNVPGPQMPLYLAGAMVKAYYPVSIVTHGLALNITILSYNGSMDYGLVAGSKAMPQLRRFGRQLRAAHVELLGIAQKRK